MAQWRTSRPTLPVAPVTRTVVMTAFAHDDISTDTRPRCSYTESGSGVPGPVDEVYSASRRSTLARISAYAGSPST